MTGLATATFPDGSLPPVEDVMKIASNLFAAGQETTARLLGTALQTLAERPELQQRLRDDRSPGLRRSSRRPCACSPPSTAPSACPGRPPRCRGTEIPAGSTVMILPSGANRDPREFEEPDELRLDRENARQHIAFGHGIHTCAGAPLGPGRVQRVPPAPARPNGGHPHLRGAPRAGRRPPLGVHAHLDAPGPRPALPRVHPCRLRARPR